MLHKKRRLRYIYPRVLPFVQASHTMTTLNRTSTVLPSPLQTLVPPDSPFPIPPNCFPSSQSKSVPPKATNNGRPCVLRRFTSYASTRNPFVSRNTLQGVKGLWGLFQHVSGLIPIPGVSVAVGVLDGVIDQVMVST
jgi:hypothetical protein